MWYFYSQRRERIALCGFGGGRSGPGAQPAVPPAARFSKAHQPPSTWMEALYFFAEALRYALRPLHAK